MYFKDIRACEIVFARHGTARKRKSTPDGDVMAFVHDEMSRELTLEGRKEVPFLGKFDLVISSPAARAIQTAMIASGRNPDVILTSLSTHLWPGVNEDNLNLWELVENVYVYRRGEAVKKENMGLRQATENIFSSLKEMYACCRIDSDSANGIAEGIEKLPHRDGYRPRILVVGHMMHLQATAVYLFGEELTDEETGSKVMDILLPKAGHFTVKWRLFAV